MVADTIEAVRAVRDAVDRLEWRVRLVAEWDRPQAELFILDWDGDIAFCTERVDPCSSSGRGPRLTLPARWLKHDRLPHVRASSETTCVFATALPRDALDRIESLRDGGRLFARLEGWVTIVRRREAVNPSGWLQGFVALAGDRQERRPMIRTESFELTRDLWCTEVLATLRPPGRHVVEIACPAPTAGSGNQSVTVLLAKAQRAFATHQTEETLRLAYLVLEELRPSYDKLHGRYGKLIRDRVEADLKALMAICNAERHSGKPEYVDCKTDYKLAQYVLIGTQNLAALVLGRSDDAGG